MFAVVRWWWGDAFGLGLGWSVSNNVENTGQKREWVCFERKERRNRGGGGLTVRLESSSTGQLSGHLFGTSTPHHPFLLLIIKLAFAFSSAYFSDE